jgi:hypothetical protein
VKAGIRISGPDGNGTGKAARRSTADSNRMPSGCRTVAGDGAWIAVPS